MSNRKHEFDDDWSDYKPEDNRKRNRPDRSVRSIKHGEFEPASTFPSQLVDEDDLVEVKRRPSRG